MTTVSKIAEQRPVPQAIHAKAEAAQAPASKAAPRPVMPAAMIVPPAPVRPMAGPARIRRRHWGVLATFLGLVLLPI
ncbi:MAG: hypothetical protein U1D06_11740, partial [Paracoccaceae bacterium]|nr:hypothetical protein [Paracoccaceae bacterium]